MTTTKVRKTAYDLKRLATVIYKLMEVDGLDIGEVAAMVFAYLNEMGGFEFDDKTASFFYNEEDFYEKINFVSVTEKRILEEINNNLLEAI